MTADALAGWALTIGGVAACVASLVLVGWGLWLVMTSRF